MAQRYVPPKQSVTGQLVDVGFLLLLVFCALFLPIWLKIAVPSRVEKLPQGVTYVENADGTKEWQGVTWENLGQNPTMQMQWEKLGYSKEQAAEIITQPFQYDIDVLGLFTTFAVIVGYFLFMIFLSRKEYKQIIAEKFDR